MTKQQLEAARDWLMECTWRDLEPEDVAELTDRQVERGIARHYDGGVAGFVADSEPVLGYAAPGGVVLVREVRS